MACIISGGKSVQFRAAEAVIDQNHASRHYLAGQGLEQVNLYDSVLLNACAAHSEEYNDLFFGRPGIPARSWFRWYLAWALAKMPLPIL